MILGNLRIAEDRVLSYSAVLKAEQPRSMALVPEATFYFEAETELEKLLLQRRRWTNGKFFSRNYFLQFFFFENHCVSRNFIQETFFSFVIRNVFFSRK
jgi:cellulose synthase/poly-beta-1,6-N-acetylglucosamine synthase-like glycosyltransferase